MRDQTGEPGESLWVDGDMMFRVQGTGRDPDRIVKVRRPFALVGQGDDNDIHLPDQGVSDRHVYLHLDPRGVFVVDLVTRTGTRINGTNRMVGWLRPSESFEVAGRRITLLRIRIDGALLDPESTDDDLLAETELGALHDVTLEPSRESDSPWVLGSDLVFLGASPACGIPIKDKLAARVHCAIVRGTSGVYVVDLCGDRVALAGHEVNRAALLSDGETLTIGTTEFTIRIQPPEHHLPAVAPIERTPRMSQPLEEEDPDDRLPIPVDLVPSQSQNAILAWMVETIQGSHGEIVRQQGEFQLAMTQLVRQIQQENAALLHAHMERMEKIDRELASLRAELQSRFGTLPQPAPAALPGPESAPSPAPEFEATVPPPPLPPLRIPRNVPEVDSQASTAWLLDRVNQLENENRSAWRALLSRLTSLPKRAP